MEGNKSKKEHIVTCMATAEFYKERIENNKVLLQKENRKNISKSMEIELRGDISELEDRYSVLQESIRELNRMVR